MTSKFTKDDDFLYIVINILFINHHVSVIYIFRCLFIPRHSIVVGYYVFTLDVSVSVHLPVCGMYVHPSVCQYFCFWMIS